MALDNLIQERLKKLQNIKDAGINPYPAKSDRTHTISEARDLGGEVVYVAGRIRSLRPHGKITFVDLEDFTGRIQLFFSVDTLNGKYDFLKNLDIGDFIEARGEVFTTQAGEITIKVESFDLLTKSIRPLPSQWYGLKDKEERFRKRYLDLILNPDIRERFILKSKFWNNIRKFLLDNRFIEVETPALEPIPGGADARPFVTHHFAQDIDLYLRISLELYQKRLLVGGFEKIFEIGRIFRNEGIDEEHLQDYTQMEFYWAYADNEMLIEFVEKMLKTVIQETLGTLKTTWRGHEIDWSVPWPRVNYTELLNSYWQVDIDKMSVEDLYKLAEKMQIQIESGLGKGRVLDYLYKKTIRPHLIQPQFLINHPIDVSPLAKRIDKDPDKVGRMQLLAMGSELTNGYSELNDPLDQRARFEEQMALRRIGDEEAQMMDLDFVEALEYGMPPAAGFGMSERFFAMLMDQPVREMVFFPTMKAERPENRKFKNKSDDVGEDRLALPVMRRISF